MYSNLTTLCTVVSRTSKQKIIIIPFVSNVVGTWNAKKFKKTAIIKNKLECVGDTLHSTVTAVQNHRSAMMEEWACLIWWWCIIEFPAWYAALSSLNHIVLRHPCWRTDKNSSNEDIMTWYCIISMSAFAKL